MRSYIFQNLAAFAADVLPLPRIFFQCFEFGGINKLALCFVPLVIGIHRSFTKYACVRVVLLFALFLDVRGNRCLMLFARFVAAFWRKARELRDGIESFAESVGWEEL